MNSLLQVFEEWIAKQIDQRIEALGISANQITALNDSCSDLDSRMEDIFDDFDIQDHLDPEWIKDQVQEELGPIVESEIDEQMPQFLRNYIEGLTITHRKDY